MRSIGNGSLVRAVLGVAALVAIVAACSGTPVAPSAEPSVNASAGAPSSVSPPPASTTPSPSSTSAAAIAPLSCPDGLAFGAVGVLYIADVCTNRVLAVSPDGTWSVVAGTGQAGYSGDGGPATEAKLEYVGSVAVDGAGDLHVVECGGNVIRRVDPDGVISTVAGVGGRGAGKGGYSGDGGPAIEAELHCPSDAVFDAAGNAFVVDRTNSVVRRVDASGVIETVAGGGGVDVATIGPTDAIPATDARFAFESPVQIAVGADGALYLVDEPGHRVWRVDPDGSMTTYAGTGQPGFSGDGGPAAEAQLNGPYGLAIDGTGNVFIGDYENARIRRVDPDGVITTVAGTGVIGTGGDGGPAVEAQLRSPYGLAVDGAGNLYFADQESAVIRVIDAAGVIRTLPFDQP